MTLPQHRDHRVMRTIRSTTGLVVIAITLGLALASTIALVAWLIASGLHHASNS